MNAEKSIYDRFIDYLYENHQIGNGHQLTRLMEDTEEQLKFLNDNDLPEDTPLEPESRKHEGTYNCPLCGKDTPHKH